MQHIPQTNAAYVLIIAGLEFTSMDKALHGTSLTTEILSNVEMIDLSEAVKVVKNIGRHSHTPNWPAIFGNHLGVATHGSVGYSAVSAPTVGKALATFVEWFPIRAECYRSQIRELEDAFEIVIFDTSGDSFYKTFFFESFMRALEVLMGLLLGQLKPQLTQLHLESHAAERQELMRAGYCSTLHFGAPQNKLIVPKSIWFQPSPLSDVESHELNLKKCKQISDQRQQKGRVDISVKHILANHLENRIFTQDAGRHHPSLKQVSNDLHLSERTLVRKLNKLGTSFQELLEHQRKYYADKLLRQARYTVTDVSLILGYSESASFCRAFKQWFGISPTAYRRNPPN